MEHTAYCQAKSSAMDGLQQQKLQDSLKRKDLLPWDSERFRKITKLIVECIAEDNQPLSLVENSKEATSISLTTDLWSSGVAPMSLLSPTAHCIDSSFTLHNVVLHASELRGSHTVEHIQKAIEEMLAKWDINKDQVHVIMRDNAANMKKVSLPWIL